MRNLTIPSRRSRPSCSVLALATVLVVGATPAAAQSFLGSGSFTHNGGGSAAITTPNATTTQITVNAGQTVIDWTPNDNAIGGGSINFQNSGTTANFLGTGNYAVLNRINPADSTRAISMNGTIQALGLGATAAANGSLYFYTPGGFVIGGNAVINVGSLVLSASPIMVDASGNFITGAANTVTFGQATQAGAQIGINSGAQINALNSGSYVAMVAPSIIQNGTVTVNGSAALVAAEAATISFSPDGLFDIQVTSGTTSTFGISSVGDIGGSISSGAGDNHRIHLVAVPKNQALTMVIGAGADLGFNVAGAANVDGNAIVLSAGYDVVDGVAGTVRSAGGGTGASTINAVNFNATSALTAAATSNVYLGATTGTSTYHSDVTLRAPNEAWINSSNVGSLVRIKGNLSISADRTIAAGLSGTAGLAALYTAAGGSIIAEQDVTVTANATGASSSTAGVAGASATGGRSYVQSQTGGSLSILGNVSQSATGVGGDGLVAGAAGGLGTGGTIQFQTFDAGSTVNVTGFASSDASGTGGSSSQSGVAAENGIGGTIYVGARSVNSSLTVGGLLSTYADGHGGNALAAGVNGGNGTGGSIFINSSESGASTILNSGAAAYAGGYGGDSGGEGCFSCTGSAGSGLGGAIQFSTSTGGVGTALTVNGNIFAAAEGRGGYGNVAGGLGTGGIVSSTYASSSIITLNGNVDFSAIGYGGGTSGGTGGTGQGGRVIYGAQPAASGSLTVTSNASSNVSGYGGSSYTGTGGLGLGGQTDNGGSAGNVDFQGNFSGVANGYGGSSQFGTGGNAIGGSGWVEGFGATVEIGGDYSMTAQAYGGYGSTGGNATGGLSLLQATAGSTVTVGGNASVSSDAFGGYTYASNGVGGNATGGTARIQAGIGSAVGVNGSADISADGSGGDNYAYFGGTGTGGNGTGGTAHLISNGGTLTVGTAFGNSINSVEVTADGSGGYAYGGNGGNGTGGVFAEIAAVDGDLTINGNAYVSASGVGGHGFTGGDGLGSGDTSNADQALWTGGAHIYARNGDIVITGSAGVYSTGTGGDGGTSFGYGGQYGGDGGDGTGGWASIHAANSGLGPSSVSIIGSLIEGSGYAAVVTDGIGGDGGNGYEGNFGSFGGDGASDIIGSNGGNGGSGGEGGYGGDGGTGTGGRSAVTASSDNGRIDINEVYASAQAFGGDGGFAGGGGQGGPGGQGGTGIDGPGGNGGNGGNGGAGGQGGAGGSAIGGFATVGTESGTGLAFGEGLGEANYGTLTLIASATGGDGGDGGDGGVAGFGGSSGPGFPAGMAGSNGINGAAGNGGNGGNAVGGAATLLVRGSSVTVDQVTLTGNAIGGVGGLGGEGANVELDPPGIDGVGGNAVVGGEGLGVGLLVTGRFQLATQRGFLDANTITGTAIATGGLGSTNGTSQTLGQSGIFFSNADGNIGSLDLLVQADSIGTGAIPDLVVVRNGDVDILGQFRFVTSGNLSLYVDNGSLTADSIVWHAADFVPDAQYGTPETAAGTFFARVFDISTGNNFVTTAHLDSVETLTIIAPGAIEIGNVTSDADIVLQTQSGGINVGNILGGGGIDLDANSFVATGNVVGAGLIDVDAGSTIGMGTINNSGNTSLFAGTSINVGAIDSGNGAVSLITGTSSIFGDVVSAGSIVADSGDDIFLGNLTAPGDVELLAAGDILIGNATAGQNIDLDAGGYIDGGNMTAGDSVYAGAGDYIDLLDISAGIVNQSTGYEPDYNVGLLAGTTIDTGNIAAFNSIGLGAQGNITTGNIDAGNIFLALGGGNMSFGTIDSGGSTYLADDSMIALGGDPTEEGSFDPLLILAATPVSSGGSIEIRGAANVGNFQAAAGTTLIGTAINSGDQITASSGGNMTLGNLFANNDIRLTSGANIVTGNIDSYDDVALVASGSISTLDIFAYDDVSADAGTTITTDDIIGNSIDLFADGNINTGNLLTQDPFGGGQFQLQPGANITVQSGGNIDTGSINSLDGVFLAADGGIATGNITADTFIETISGGSQVLGNLTAGDFVDLDAEGGITFGVVNARSLDFTSGGAVTGGNITAISYATGEAEGALVLGNILTTGAAPIDEFSIGFSSATSILVGNASGTDRVGFATIGNLTTGNITAGRLFMALVGGDMVTGSITTAANGRVYIADSSLFETGGGLEDDVDSDIVLALAPVATGGSITINGAVTTGRFQAAAGDDLSTKAITANQIEASAENNATIDGFWSAPDVLLASGDIDITANGQIDAGTDGIITLNAVSTNGPALIGDGLTGTGYALSNAEFGRLSGGLVRIAVGGNGGDADTLIGDLTITGPLAGSTIESSDGGVEFVTLSEAGTDLDGTLRIVGNVVATGFGAENYLGFYTQNFELDAATGSISITSSGNALAGILELYASRIHVAEGTLLDQLAANPQFAGYREALNRPAAVSRPEGVINAASFDIEFGGSDITGPYTLFVQNMGTATVPAGFLLNAANISDDSEGDLAPGSLDLAINGQIIGEGGTLTGVAVRDLLVTEFGTEIFAVGSTINGCPLTGSCSATPIRIDTIVRTDVQINDPTGLGDGVDGSLNNPPNPLLDTDFLGQSGDIDDPVSGAGNPSLMGTSDDEDDACDKNNEGKCEPANNGDGK